jgi:pimeloyl-ACP methyl ester carboxylesterase
MGEPFPGFAANVIDSSLAYERLDDEISSQKLSNAATTRHPTAENDALRTRSIAPALRLPLEGQTLPPLLNAGAGLHTSPARIGAPSLERRLWPQAFSCGQREDLDRTQLREIGVYAAFAEFPYQLDLEKLANAIEYADPDQRDIWTPLDSTLAKTIASDAGLTRNGLCFSDGNGGMKAYIFVDKIKRKAILVFGGTSSTSIGGGSYNLRRLVWGARDQFNQWWANFQSVFGSQAPQSYIDAARLLGAARKHLGDYEWSTCGHSKGGAEAAFAAAMNSVSSEAVKAACFCAPPFGASLMNELLATYPGPRQLRLYATEYIRHINVEGDPVPALDRVVVNAAHIGTAYTLPATQLSSPWLVQRAAEYLSKIVGGACVHVDFWHQVLSFIHATIDAPSDENDPRAIQRSAVDRSIR